MFLCLSKKYLIHFQSEANLHPREAFASGKPVLQFAKVDDEENQARTTGFFNCDIDMSSFDDPVDGMEEYV